MSRLAFISLLVLLALPLCAQDEAARADKLIKQLGSEDWATRERASRDLVGIGDPAREALHGALIDDDPEVRVRASNALISIGEEFSFAVECATDESERLRDHGRAALMNLFKIDDSKVLRELNQQEIQPRWRRWDDQLNVMAPPTIALARVQAVSGYPILVADDVRKDWDRAMEQPTANISIRGSAEQISYIRDGLRTWLSNVLGNLSVDKQLMPRPMRIGRTNFLYITRMSTTSGLSRRCGEQLVADLLKEGDTSVRAAGLLADGASSDSEAADRIREQYVKNAELTRLMWLAISLGADAATIERVRARDHADALALLKSHDWKVMELGAKYLRCLEPEKLGEALSPIVANSDDSLELLAGVWISRGAPLDESARARVGRLVTSKQDMLAAAAARWFAGANDVTDAELQAVWQAGEFQPLDSSFFTAALELVQRPDVGDRLVESARKSFEAAFAPGVARHALAAAVLIGRATPADLAVALNLLTGARSTPKLAAQMAEMFRGCTELPEEAMKKFHSRLYDSDATVRSVYLEALRMCDPTLRLKIAADAIASQSKEDADVSLPKHAAFARIALKGILSGAGDPNALDEIIKTVEGDDIDQAKAGGRAFVDAFEGDALFSTLEELNNRADITHGAVAALEGYLEICRRAVRAGDRVLFRKSYGIAFNMQILNQNWQLRQELMNMQGTIAAGDSDGRENRPLPPDPVLKQTDVAVK
ncbi:MAG: HEAT repeat domain-containing protein [Planctomycetota bacterium]